MGGSWDKPNMDSELGFPVVKNLPDNAGDKRDAGSIPGLGRSLGGGHGNPLQHSCLENHMDREAWWATVHWVTKSWTWVTEYICINSEPGKARWLAKGNLEEMSCISDSSYHKGVILWAHHVSIYKYSSLLINTLFVSLLSIFVRILFCKAKGPGSCHWPLIYWLGFSTLSIEAQPQSLARNQNSASNLHRTKPPQITTSCGLK